MVGALEVAWVSGGFRLSENRRTQKILSTERQVYGTPAAPSAGLHKLPDGKYRPMNSSAKVSARCEPELMP